MSEPVCRNGTYHQTGQLYLESNTVNVGEPVTNGRCQCLVTTDCDSNLTFFAVTVQLTQVNTSVCAEEFFLTDAKYPQLTSNVTCRNDDNVVYNQTLFTTLSNMATFSLAVIGQQKGKVYVRVQSSVPTANITVTCGAPAVLALNQSQQCPNSITTIPTTSTTVNEKPEGSTFNSSLACTRGETQTDHIIDCKDHYPDGGRRSLSIIRVFYGATPLSRYTFIFTSSTVTPLCVVISVIVFVLIFFFFQPNDCVFLLELVSLCLFKIITVVYIRLGYIRFRNDILAHGTNPCTLRLQVQQPPKSLQTHSM